MNARFYRLAETDRTPIELMIDGKPIFALQGDTLLVALLSGTRHVRVSEFGDTTRAGFCLMGACQDCWVWTESGDRLRACSTQAESGMSLLTSQPEGSWISPV